MDIDLRLLRYFTAVAEDLHFGRAAARLYVSQSALSEAIRKLEASLGVMLFVRDRRHVELTEAGMVLKAQAPDILKHLERATAAVLASARKQARHFRVGYSPFVELSRIWSLRSKFAKQVDWDLELISLKTLDLVAALLRGEMEAGILVGPVIVEELEIVPLRSEPFIIGLPSGHALSDFETLTFENIASESVIWMPRSFNPVFYDYVVARCAALGFSLRPEIEVTTLQECLQLIADRRGITLTTDSAQSLKHPGVIFRQLREPIGVDTVASFRRDTSAEFLAFFLAITRSAFSGTDQVDS